MSLLVDLFHRMDKFQNCPVYPSNIQFCLLL